MTTYTFVPLSSTTSVSWTDPTIWSGGVAPNDPTADVVIPQTIVRATGQAYVSVISLTTAVSVNSLSIVNNILTESTAGSLSVGGEFSVGANASVLLNGSLSAAYLVNDGQSFVITGQITVSGALQNNTFMQSMGGPVSITAAKFTNLGTLEANAGQLTITTEPGSLANLSDGVFVGGTYIAAANSVTQTGQGLIRFDVGGTPTSAAAAITLEGGDIQFYDDAAGAYVSITSSLQTIAAAGSLTLLTPYNWGNLTVDGLLTLGVYYGNNYGALTTTGLTIDSTGTVTGLGSLSGPVTDNGTILAAVAPGGTGNLNTLTVTGPVTGSGALEVAAAIVQQGAGFTYYRGASLELGAAASVDVKFMGGHGLLILDDPTQYTGTISAAGEPNQIEFSKTAISGYSFSGDADGGVLTVQTGAGVADLKLKGQFDTDGFVLTKVGSDSFLTFGPPLTPKADLNGDDLSDILIQDAGGAVAVGELGSGGQLAYAAAGSLGPEWQFEGVGYLKGNGGSQFLIESTSGAVVLGEIAGGATTYSQVGALAPDWTFEAIGDFLGDSHDQFMIKNDVGAYVVGTVQADGQATYLQVAGLGSDWSLVGEGDFLSTGHDQFLLENANGAIVAADVENQPYYGVPYHFVTTYSQIGALGPTWHFEETGNFLGHGKSDFLIESDSGTLVVGEVGNGVNPDAVYTQVGALGADWRFVGAGDYTRSGPDSFLIQNATTGAVVLGQVVAGAAQYTQIGALGANWTFHS